MNISLKFKVVVIGVNKSQLAIDCDVVPQMYNGRKPSIKYFLVTGSLLFFGDYKPKNSFMSIGTYNKNLLFAISKAFSES